MRTPFEFCLASFPEEEAAVFARATQGHTGGPSGEGKSSLRLGQVFDIF